MIRTVENPIVTLEDVLPLYEAVGWTNYTTKPEMLEAAYKNSLHILAALNEEEKLVGVLSRGLEMGRLFCFISRYFSVP